MPLGATPCGPQSCNDVAGAPSTFNGPTAVTMHGTLDVVIVGVIDVVCSASGRVGQ